MKSPDFAKTYFVAGVFTATGVPDQTGVWATNSLAAGGGLIMAVDSLARQFTVWPDASKTDAGIAKDDPSVATAKACLK